LNAGFTAETASAEQIRRVVDSLVEERFRLDATRDASLLAANAIAVEYWREALVRKTRVEGRGAEPAA
jgi:hypothetical protein